MLDTTAINKRMADKADNPYRWRTGSFRLPKSVVGEMKDKMTDAACNAFLQAFERQGWKLESKVQVVGPFTARDLGNGAVLLDQDEWRVRAIFSTVPKPVRIEVPAGLVRQDPEQNITLKEALKAD